MIKLKNWQVLRGIGGRYLALLIHRNFLSVISKSQSWKYFDVSMLLQPIPHTFNQRDASMENWIKQRFFLQLYGIIHNFIFEKMAPTRNNFEISATIYIIKEFFVMKEFSLRPPASNVLIVSLPSLRDEKTSY